MVQLEDVGDWVFGVRECGQLERRVTKFLSFGEKRNVERKLFRFCLRLIKIDDR